MSERLETVGEVVDRRGPCELMSLVVQLAEKHGRIPVGHWNLHLGGNYALEVNGTPDDVNGIKPWNAIVTREGLPLVYFDAAGGIQVGTCGEDKAISALQRALAAMTPSVSAERKERT
jgi:hypothetical protein